MGSSPGRDGKSKLLKSNAGQSKPFIGQCPYCHKEIKIPVDNSQRLPDGIKVPCPECGKIISVKSG